MRASRKDYNEMAEIIREASWLIDVAPHTAKEVGIDPYDLVMNLGYFFEENNPNFDLEKWCNACTPKEEEAKQS